MPLFGALSMNCKSTDEEDRDVCSVLSTVSTRASTPPRLPAQQLEDSHEAQAQILMQLSETEWHLRQHQAAFGTLRVDFTTQIHSMEGHLSQQLEVIRLKCDTDLGQIKHDLAQQLHSFSQRLDVLEAKQDDCVMPRVDALAGRLELTNLKIEQMSQTTPVDGGVAAEDHHVQCSPDQAVLSRKVDLLESALEAMKAQERETCANLVQHVNVEGQASIGDCLRRLEAFGDRLDRMEAKLDGFYSADSTTTHQLLELGCRLEIVDSKLSMVLSDSLGAPHDGSEGAKVSLQDHLVNPDAEQLTRDFAAKLCGVNERLQILEEQLSQNLPISGGASGAEAHSYLLQNMIIDMALVLQEDTQKLAALQHHYVEQRKLLTIYTDDEVLRI